MSDHVLAHDSTETSHGQDHGPGFYIKIWGLLVILLIISILGPLFGIVWVTLVTAFGIAIIKAGMVAAYFMHLNIEKRYIWYLLYAMLMLMFLLVMGVAPDIMRHEGNNWVNQVSRNLADQYREGPHEPMGGHH
jgi:caa(3)-type oxidase subunit IV